MRQKRYTDEFRREAIRQVTEKGHAVKEVAERIGLSTYSLYEWIKKYGPATGAQASRMANKDDSGSSSGSESPGSIRFRDFPSLADRTGNRGTSAAG